MLIVGICYILFTPALFLFLATATAEKIATILLMTGTLLVVFSRFKDLREFTITGLGGGKLDLETEQLSDKKEKLNTSEETVAQQ